METLAGFVSSVLRLKTRGEGMGSYHLYYLRDSQVIGFDDIEAPDDDEAVRVARRQGEGNAVEVWNAHSRIRVVAPDASTPPLRMAH
jgi:hypothetical protein